MSRGARPSPCRSRLRATARLGDIRAEAYEARFDRELASVWRPVGELYRADLGAAAASARVSPETSRPAIPLT